MELQKEKKQDIRKEIEQAMTIPYILNGSITSERIEQYGYPPLIVED